MYSLEKQGRREWFRNKKYLKKFNERNNGANKSLEKLKYEQSKKLMRIT